MAVEILTVSLSDESIREIAERVAHLLDTGNRSVTQSNPPSSQNTQSAERSGSQRNSDPWQENEPRQEQRQQQGQSQDSPPHCDHGPMKYAGPGFSNNSGKAYGPSWRCQGPRGQWCNTIWMDSK